MAKTTKKNTVKSNMSLEQQGTGVKVPAKKKNKPGAGRPKKTLEDLPKDWKAKVIARAKVGGSDVEIRCLLDCMSDDLWERLIAEDEEFSRTIKRAHIFCQDWWEQQGRKSLRKKNFQTGLWTMNMKNRFGWKDKTETQYSGEVKVTIVDYKDADKK